MALAASKEYQYVIVPLRKQRDDGTKYFRPTEIEDALTSLYQLPIAEVARRASVSDKEDPDYVPSECLVHFVRQSKANGDSKPYRDIFAALRSRVIRAVPVRLRRVPGVSKSAEADSESQIQEKVIFDFQKLLCSDRQEYDQRFDYYEIKFNSAIATLRATARRAFLKKESRRKPMEFDGEASDLSLEMEEALERAKHPNGQKEDDFAYRLRFLEAISALPSDQRRVIELLLDDVPIDSENPEARSICKILGCYEKTVRNRRDRAYAAIRKALNEEKVT
jgi:DNA-directed RNA polymerase specialized sigma24 family protein